MKVTVKMISKTSPVHYDTIIESYEKLFQENKDLRVDFSHAQDELRLLRQQNEAQRQKLVEKDALIAELNEQIEASEQEIKNLVVDVQVKMEIQEELGDKVAELRSELHDRNAQVDELEHRNQWLYEENKALDKRTVELEKSNDEWMVKYEKLQQQVEADDKKATETCKACNELYEEVLAERNHLRTEVERLTCERNTVVDENTQMMFEMAKLRDDYEVSEKALKVTRDIASDAKVRLTTCQEQLTEAHLRIEEQQKTISDASETISNLQAKITANEITPALNHLFRMMGGR